jgi:hypothetical protein
MNINSFNNNGGPGPGQGQGQGPPDMLKQQYMGNQYP